MKQRNAKISCLDVMTACIDGLLIFLGQCGKFSAHFLEQDKLYLLSRRLKFKHSYENITVFIKFRFKFTGNKKLTWKQRCKNQFHL